VQARLAHARGADRPRGVVVPHDAAGVVVDAEEVERPAHRVEVRVGGSGPGLAEDRRQLLRMAAEDRRIEVLAVHVGVGSPGRLPVVLRLRRRVLRLEVDDEADPGHALRAERVDRGAVGAEQIVRCDRRLEEASVSGRQAAVEVAAVGDHPRLVERRPHRHAPRERAAVAA
jgi:hypothetical protein